MQSSPGFASRLCLDYCSMHYSISCLHAVAHSQQLIHKAFFLTKFCVIKVANLLAMVSDTLTHA